jgi:hypothetical protein
MPHVSGRSKLLNELEMMLLTLLKHGDVNSADFEELLTFRSTVQAIRYLDLRKQIRRDREMEALLKRMTPAQFKLYARMDLASFVAILANIEADDVFKTPNNLKKQAPVWCQFWVVLQRLGCSGNGASIGHIGFQSGFSTGSVHAFTKRVFIAVLKLKREVIYWPDAAERAELSARMKIKYGLEGAVLDWDGTQVVLAQKPAHQGEVYWTRKCQYAMNLQLCCDDTSRVRWYDIGWPGSVYDNYIFERTKICKERQHYFSEGEYLLADSGYAALRDLHFLSLALGPDSVEVPFLLRALLARGFNQLFGQPSSLCGRLSLTLCNNSGWGGCCSVGSSSNNLRTAFSLLHPRRASSASVIIT